MGGGWRGLILLAALVAAPPGLARAQDAGEQEPPAVAAEDGPEDGESGGESDANGADADAGQADASEADAGGAAEPEPGSDASPGADEAADEGQAAQAARPPTPEEDQRARELFRLGDRLYQHGQYDAAIDAFEEAYRLSRRPLMLFNLANAQERAGYLPAAIVSLEGYIDDAPEDERTAIANRLAALRERVASPDATSDASPPTPDPIPPDGPATGSTPPDLTPSDPPPPAGPDLTPAALTLAVAGAFVVAGVAFAAAAIDARSQVDGRCARAADGRHVCPSDVASQIDSDTLFSGLADASWVLAAGATALGVYLLADALSGGSEEAEASIDVGGAVLPEAAYAHVRVRF